MSCRLVRRHLGALVDGELDPATHIEFERHLASCAGCQEELAFERSMRRQVRNAVGGTRAPDALRSRVLAALEQAPPPASYAEHPERAQPRPLVRVLPVRARHAVPLALAAAVLLAFGVVPTGSEEATGAVRQASSAPLLEDVVRLHSSELPADVAGDEPKHLARYLRNKVGFPVRPAEFDRHDVKLLGGRVSNVRDRRAAALYYDVHGRRVTVVVFQDPRLVPQGSLRVRLAGREVSYQQIGGYIVPVRRSAGLSYAFAGDVDRETMLRLAASSRLQR